MVKIMKKIMKLSLTKFRLRSIEIHAKINHICMCRARISSVMSYSLQPNGQQYHVTRCTLHRSEINRVTVYSLVQCHSFPSFEPVHYSMFSSNLVLQPCLQVFRRQKRWSCVPISFRCLTQAVVIHRVKIFSAVIKAEQMFFFFQEFSCFLYNPTNVGNLTSGFSTFSNPSCISKFSVHVLLNKPQLEGY